MSEIIASFAERSSIILRIILFASFSVVPIFFLLTPISNTEHLPDNVSEYDK